MEQKSLQLRSLRLCLAWQRQRARKCMAAVGGAVRIAITITTIRAATSTTLRRDITPTGAGGVATEVP